MIGSFGWGRTRTRTHPRNCRVRSTATCPRSSSTTPSRTSSMRPCRIRRSCAAAPSAGRRPSIPRTTVPGSPPGGSLSSTSAGNGSACMPRPRVILRPTNRPYSTVPGLFARLDKRGLLPLSRNEIDNELMGNDRPIFLDDFAAFPHPYIRENRELVADVLSLTDKGVDARIALDPHRVVARGECPDAGLYDYWFGVRLDRDKLDDISVVGRARYERRVDAHGLSPNPLLANRHRLVDGRRGTQGGRDRGDGAEGYA